MPDVANLLGEVVRRDINDPIWHNIESDILYDTHRDIQNQVTEIEAAGAAVRHDLDVIGFLLSKEMK